MNKISKLFNSKFLLCIQYIISVVFLIFLFYINILPWQYSVMIIGGMLLVNIVLYYINIKHNITFKVVTTIFCILLMLAIIYMNKSIETLDKITEINDEINRVSLIVKKDSDYQSIQDLENKIIQINTKYNVASMGAAMNQLNELISCNYSSEDDFIKMATNLYERDIDAILVNEAYLWVMEHKYEDFVEDTRVIWTYEHKKEKDDIKKTTVVNNNFFNVFISGIDAEGDVSTVSRSDVNMLATVNMATNQILLTSIPRDYYVYISELKAKDKLTHAGLMGINSSVSILEDLLNIDINYYVKVNFTTLIMMVDALGGIEIYSPYRIGKPGGANYFESGTLLLNG